MAQKMLLESITQEITQVLEALCQEPGAETKSLLVMSQQWGSVEKESRGRVEPQPGEMMSRMHLWKVMQSHIMELIHPMAKEAGLFLYQVLVIAHGGRMEAEGIG